MTPTEQFFSSIQIPFNSDWEENGFEFVNSVNVAEVFIKATAHSASLAEEAEKYTSDLANLDYQRGKKERELLKLRRSIFADKWNEITKSAGPEIQNAFILAKADEEQRTKLLAIEDEIEKLDDQVGRIKPRLDKVRNRMKLLERNMDWAKQFLDFDKLMKRITEGGRPF